MSFGRLGIRSLDRLTHEHALLLAVACLVILVLSFPLPPNQWPAFHRSSKYSERDDVGIDAALQQAATAALDGREGAIIVMDPQNGRIRALVNPQVAFEQASMPGSTMKPFTALAALRAGLIDKDSRKVCPGRFTGRSFSLPCVHADHLPPFTPAQAIAYSCNYYFASLGQRLGRDKLIDTLRAFGFGQPVAIAEAAGTLRPCETGSTARLRESAHATRQSDCDAREAIGESDQIQVTPLQLLTAYAALVNGGHLWEPRAASAGDFQRVERSRIEISPQHREIIIEGMRGAVRYGTAKHAQLDSLPLYVLGKTGTSLPPKGFRSNGWFIGFASINVESSQNPPKPSAIDLAVLILTPRSHGAEAARLAKPIFEGFANETANVHRRAAEDRRDGAETNPSNSAIRNPQSAIVRVHLVTENVTQEMSLEDYVLGVLRTEGSMETEPEALKALAIAIRTYALKNRGRHAKDGYDFCTTTHCQRFMPAGVGSPRVSNPNSSGLPDGRVSDTIIQAVHATEGQVLLDEYGRVVDSYFGASCGGESANIGTLWGKNPPPYLRGVHDEFCVTGAHANWTDDISRIDLLRALKSDSRTDVGNRLDQVIVNKRDETGRAEFVTLEGEHRKVVRGWDFKIIVGRVLGWNLLKSSRFEVSRNGSNFIFRGSGFGHGLGLCQEGAHVMAERGIRYQRILEKYFPGTRIAPRSGNVSLARPFKAGKRGEQDSIVASATNEFASLQSSPTRRIDWHADIIPALKGRAKIMRHSATKILQPQSGAMFVETQSRTNAKLRRSAIFSIADFGKDTRAAPAELWKPTSAVIYEYFVPTGLSLIQKYIAISSEHFRVTYPANVDRREADLVLNTLETARTDYLHRASVASITPDIPALDIRLNESTGNFTARTGQPWWAAAATKGNKIELQPLSILKHRGVLTTTLRHELAHAVIDSISHDHAPRWLAEGFAIYLAGEGSAISRYTTKTRLTVDDLERKLERPSSRQEMRALYAAAYREVMRLIQTEGEGTVWSRLANQ